MKHEVRKISSRYEALPRNAIFVALPPHVGRAWEGKLRFYRMKSEKSLLIPTLFPYSMITEPEEKRLLLLLPKLQVLRILPVKTKRDEVFPFTTYRFPIGDKEVLDNLRKAVFHDQQFIGEHSDGETLVIIREMLEEESVESAPFQIVSHVRGRFFEQDKDQDEIWKAAYFFQLGVELEEKGFELDKSLGRVEELENEFREVLGLEEEGDHLFGIDPLRASPWEEYRDFNLRKKIRSWAALWFHMGDEPFILVLVTSAVMDELEEVLGAIAEQFGKERILREEFVGELTDPGPLAVHEVYALRRELMEKKSIQNGWGSLEKFLGTGNTEDLEAFKEYFLEVDKRIRSSVESKELSRVEVRLKSVEGFSGSNMLKAVKGFLASGDIPELDEEKRCLLVSVVPCRSAVKY